MQNYQYKETCNITIRKNIKQKHNLWKRYMETRSPVVYGKYCRMRNKVKNMIKYTRKQKEKQISGNIKNNPKAFLNYKIHTCYYSFLPLPSFFRILGIQSGGFYSNQTLDISPTKHLICCCRTEMIKHGIIFYIFQRGSIP